MAISADKLAAHLYHVSREFENMLENIPVFYQPPGENQICVEIKKAEFFEAVIDESGIPRKGVVLT